MSLFYILSPNIKDERELKLMASHITLGLSVVGEYILEHVAFPDPHLTR